MTSKRIIITGVTGYLGSHIAKALLAEGYDVVALKRKTSRLHRLESILSRLTFYDIDGLDFTSLFQECREVDVVIHTATCYGRDGESVSQISEANTQYPLKLLEAAVTADVGTFINTDTSLDKQLNAYTLSKKQLVDWGRYFANSQEINFLNINLEHSYGPGDEPTKFPTHVINSCLGNVPELKLTEGEQKRDFIYIDDVVSAYIILLKNVDSFNSIYMEFDVGSGQSVSIREFVEIVHRFTASKTHLAFGALPYRDGEVMYSEADISGLTAIGWRCCYDLETGLKQAVEQERKRL